ncbi:MAG: hypothetical protein RSB55_10470 [Oscillospiraceae bacterium]
MSEMMDKLLALELPEAEEKTVEVARLSALCGSPVLFTLRELPFNRVNALGKLTEDADLYMLLESISEPNLKDSGWYEGKMGCPTPVEAMRKLLKPGEIRALVREFDKLEGYGGLALRDVAKK